MIFKGKNALILGNGTSGKGAAYVLKAEGAVVTIDETDGLPEGIDKYDLAVISPGIKHDHPIYRFAAVHDLPLVGEIGLGAMFNSAPVLGVTGTNGKTTVVGMLGAIYEAADVKAEVCGNVGRSFAQTAYDRVYNRAILELSSFQLLQSSPLKVHIACITNIAADHLDYHGNMLEYRHAKLRIADSQTADDYFIVPRGFNLVGMRGRPTILYAGEACYEKKGELYALDETIMAVDELPVAGAHNAENALNAALMARLDGIPAAVVRRGLMNFRPAAHRIAPVGALDGTTFFNDSKGTNVSATLAAARCMIGSAALIVGGRDKGYDYDELFLGLPDNVTAVFVTGENSQLILASAERTGYRSIAQCSGLGDAVRRAASGGFDNVLFSPASASFDRYANYAERGNAFECEVKKLFGSV